MQPSWLDALLFGYRVIQDAGGSELPARSKLAVNGVSVVDDPDNHQTVMTLAGTTAADPSSFVVRDSAGAITNVRNGLGFVGGVPGVSCVNETPATATALLDHQVPPAVVMTGQGWNGSASIKADWAIQCYPSGNSSELYLMSQIGGGGYSIRLSVTSAGALKVPGALTHNGSTVGFYGVTPASRPAAYTQTYSTADRTLGAYTPDPESSAYTGIDNAQGGSVYAKLADVNALRTAYENLRAFTEDLAQLVNAMLDDDQANGLKQ